MIARFIVDKIPSGTSVGSIAIISNPNGLGRVKDITEKSFHPVWSNNALLFGLYEGQSLRAKINQSYSAFNFSAGVEYEIGWEIEDSGSVKFYLPDGTSVEYTGSDYSEFLGRYCTFEFYWNNGDAIAKPKFTYFEVNCNNASPLIDDFHRENGALGISPQGHVYKLISKDLGATFYS